MYLTRVTWPALKCCYQQRSWGKRQSKQTHTNELIPAIIIEIGKIPNQYLLLSTITA